MWQHRRCCGNWNRWGWDRQPGPAKQAVDCPFTGVAGAAAAGAAVGQPGREDFTGFQLVSSAGAQPEQRDHRVPLWHGSGLVRNDWVTCRNMGLLSVRRGPKKHPASGSFIGFSDSDMILSHVFGWNRLCFRKVTSVEGVPDSAGERTIY